MPRGSIISVTQWVCFKREAHSFCVPPCPAPRDGLPAAPTRTHIFIGIGVLRLGLVRDRSVTVRAVVLALVVSCPVVRDEEQLLDVSLEDNESPEQAAQRAPTWGPRRTADA